MNISNKTLNLDTILKMTNSILIKKCNNLEIIINNKINKIIIDKSSNINCYTNTLINGFEINKSNNIKIQGIIIPNIELYKSTLYLQGEYENIKDTKINCEESLLNLIIG